MIYPMELIERQQVVGWEAVQPTGARGKPDEYIKAIDDLDAAWNEYNRLCDAYDVGKAEWCAVLAAEEAAEKCRKEASRIYERWQMKLAAQLDDGCTCLPDAVTACPVCRARIAIRMGDEIPFGGAA